MIKANNFNTISTITESDIEHMESNVGPFYFIDKKRLNETFFANMYLKYENSSRWLLCNTFIRYCLYHIDNHPYYQYVHKAVVYQRCKSEIQQCGELYSKI